MADLTININVETKEAEKKASQLSKIGAKALETLKDAVIQLAKEGFKAGVEFESAFAGVSNAVNATDFELAQMRKELLGLSQEVPVAAKELAGIAQAAGELGIANENITSFTETMAHLGAVTNMTGGEAAKLMAQFAKSTGMPQTEFENLGSAVVALSGSLGVADGDILTMAGGMAEAASKAGFTEASIAALAASLLSVGVEAGAGGEVITRVFGAIETAVANGGAGLQGFADLAGMTAGQFAQAWGEDAAGAFDALLQGMGETQAAGGDTAAALAQLGISAEADISALTRLAGAGDVFAGSLATANTAFTENSALATAAGQQYATLEGQMQMLTNSAQGLAIGIFDAMRPAFVEAVGSMRRAMDDLQAAFARPEMQGALQSIGAAISGVIKVVSTQLSSILPLLVRILGAAIQVGGGLLNAFESIGKLITKTLTGALDLFATLLEAVAKNMKVFGPIIVTVTAAIIAYNAAVALQVFWQKAMAAEGAKTLLMKAAMVVKNIALAAAEGGLVGATLAAGVAFHALTAAMHANPVGLVVAGIVALVAALGSLLYWLNEDSDALAQMKEDTEEATKASQELRAEIGESAEAHAEAASSIDTEATANDKLISQLFELQGAYDGSHSAASKISVIVDQLNSGVDGLNLAFDEQTGQLNMTKDASKALSKAYFENAKAQVEASRITELTKDLVKLEEQQRANRAIMASWTTTTTTAGRAGRGMTDEQAALNEEMRATSQAMRDTQAQINYYTDAAAEAAIATQEAADAYAQSDENLTPLAEKYDTTVEAIRAATDGTAEGLDAWVTSQEEAYARSQELLEGYVESATSGWDEITQKQTVSIDQYIANLKNNQDAQANWNTNMNTLMAAGISGGVLAELEKLGPEGAAISQAWVDQLNGLADESGTALGSQNEAVAGKIEELNSTFALGVETAQTTTEDAWARESFINSGSDAVSGIAFAVGENTELADSMQAQVEGAISSTQTVVVEMAPALNGIGKSLVDGIVAGINANAYLVANAMSSVVTEGEAAAKKTGVIKSPSRLMRDEVGVWLAAGVAEGIEDGTVYVTDAVENQAQAILDAYGGIDPDLDAAGLADTMRGMFDDVPDEFFTIGETAGEQFVAGFSAAAFAYFALFENMMAGDVLLASTVSARGQSAERPIEIHFHDEVQAPDTVARAVRNVFEYGLAGERN